MKTPKSNSKSKSTGRKAVVQAFANQDKENQKEAAQIQEAIRLKAYELYIERGGSHGNDLEDWVTAERLVLQNS